jgi:hypothetical protein
VVLPEKGPALKVHLTGITTIFRGKRALLKVDFPAKFPEKAKQESYILAEGQRDGPIEVLEINDKKAEVKLVNSGAVSTITFDKTAPAPAPTPNPVVPQPHRFPKRRTFR